MEIILILYVLVAIVIIVCIIINNRNLKINNKNLKVVKQYSKLYSEIIALNNNYTFYTIRTTKLRFNPTFKSKRALENLNFHQYISDIISNNKDHFSSLFNKIKENIKRYNNYCYAYKALEVYTTKDNFSKFENTKIKFKTFVNCEKKLYKQLKLNQPIMNLTASIHATYNSPSGKYHYWRDYEFSYLQLKNVLNDIIKREQEILREKQIKEQEAAKKQFYEKKLKEKYSEEIREYKNKLKYIQSEERKINMKALQLEKQENRLSQKEREIIEKEHEFIEATKEHIYTTDKIEIQKQDAQVNDNLSLTQKLKLLRQEYDNGEITYEEYQTKRKELM